jgi:hypothetical protein
VGEAVQEVVRPSVEHPTDNRPAETHVVESSSPGEIDAFLSWTSQRSRFDTLQPEAAIEDPRFLTGLHELIDWATALRARLQDVNHGLHPDGQE